MLFGSDRFHILADLLGNLGLAYDSCISCEPFQLSCIEADKGGFVSVETVYFGSRHVLQYHIPGIG